MHYKTQAVLAEDVQLKARIAACASGRGVQQPLGWGYTHAWVFAVQDGWCCALEDDPAGDSNQIGDDLITAAVEEVLLSNPPLNITPSE